MKAKGQRDLMRLISRIKIEESMSDSVEQEDQVDDLVVKSKPPMIPKRQNGGFLPDKVELTEEQKQYSNQNKEYSNLIDMLMTPRQKGRSLMFEIQQHQVMAKLNKKMENKQSTVNQSKPAQ